MFTKAERSTFSYWFAHWCSYNMTALNLKCWKIKYLFHDFEKPWLKLFYPYEKVQKLHRTNNKHHIGYKGGIDNCDFEAMVIDWECSRFTKEAAPMTARETFDYTVTVKHHNKKISDHEKEVLEKNIPPILEKLKL